jgi:hypothetical protein
MKGVILFATRARRLALAVLAGVLFGLAGSAIANADTQTDGTSTGVVGVSTQSTQGFTVQPMDWWA